jgi:hypothetical protein
MVAKSTEIEFSSSGKIESLGLVGEDGPEIGVIHSIETAAAVHTYIHTYE